MIRNTSLYGKCFQFNVHIPQSIGHREGIVSDQLQTLIAETSGNNSGDVVSPGHFYMKT